MASLDLLMIIYTLRFVAYNSYSGYEKYMLTPPFVIVKFKSKSKDYKEGSLRSKMVTRIDWVYNACVTS